MLDPGHSSPVRRATERPSRECTGNFFLCEDVLAEEGVTDLSGYSYVEDADLQTDLFVEE